MLGNELPEETHVMTKQETLLGRGIWAKRSRIREPRLPRCMPIASGFTVMGLVSRLPLANHPD